MPPEPSMALLCTVCYNRYAAELVRASELYEVLLLKKKEASMYMQSMRVTYLGKSTKALLSAQQKAAKAQPAERVCVVYCWI